MRNPHWTFFSQITLGEVSSFLAWLDRQPAGKSLIDNADSLCPFERERLRAMLNVLSCLGFVFEHPDCLKIRHEGSTFVQADLVSKMSILRAKLVDLRPTREIMTRLENSGNGRLNKNAIVGYFYENFQDPHISDLQGFLDWARMCELFYYDKSRDEIFHIHGNFPKSASQTPTN